MRKHCTDSTHRICLGYHGNLWQETCVFPNGPSQAASHGRQSATQGTQVSVFRRSPPTLHIVIKGQVLLPWTFHPPLPFPSPAILSSRVHSFFFPLCVLYCVLACCLFFLDVVVPIVTLCCYWDRLWQVHAVKWRPSFLFTSLILPAPQRFFIHFVINYISQQWCEIFVCKLYVAYPFTLFVQPQHSHIWLDIIPIFIVYHLPVWHIMGFFLYCKSLYKISLSKLIKSKY